jgi:hypothetical protein
VPEQQVQDFQVQHGVQERRVLQPKHRALAARLAAATERQQRRQQYLQQQQLQQQGSRHGTWSPKVGADLALVCAELKLPQTLAPALSAAAAKGHISCNPGILLSQVRWCTLAMLGGRDCKYSVSSCVLPLHLPV